MDLICVQINRNKKKKFSKDATLVGNFMNVIKQLHLFILPDFFFLDSLSILRLTAIPNYKTLR